MNGHATLLSAYTSAGVLALFPGALKLVKAFTVTEGAPGPGNLLVVLLSDLVAAAIVGLLLGLLVVALKRTRASGLIVWTLTTLVLIPLLGLAAVEHQTWVKTASLLDWGILSYTLRHYDELRVVIASETTTASIVTFVVAGVVTLLPVVLDVALGHRRVYRTPSRRSLAYSALGVAVAAGLSFVPPSRPELRPISRSAVFTLLGEALSDAERSTAAASNRYVPSPDKARQHIDSQLANAGFALDPEKPAAKNVLLFILESTRFDATTLYVPQLPTTPNLARLAKNGAVVDRTYVDMPHTSKAIVSVLCGYAPRWSVEINEAEVGGLPSVCAPHVFGKLGFKTAFFQSAWGTFENRRQFVDNAGFQSFVARESLKESKFSEVNYLSVEDKAMVEPILRFVDKNKGQRFFATVMTCTSHHSYGLPNSFRHERFARHRKPGSPTPSPYEDYERYLNTVHYVDEMIGEITRGLAQRGMLDDTLVVVVGDHGQGFLEHGAKHHNDVIYEEGLRVPLLFHNRRLFPDGKTVPGLRRQVDILPTVLGLTGVQYPADLFEGRDVFASAGHTRLHSNCWYDDRCAAEYEGDLKVIDYFDNRPTEVYNVVKDPFERANLATKGSPNEQKRYQELGRKAHQRILAERQRLETRYTSHELVDRSFILKKEPAPSHRVPAHLGSYVELIGYDAATHEVTPGSSWEAVVYFRCLKPSEEGWRLFGRFETVDHRVQQLDYHPANGRFDLKDCAPGTIISDRLRMWLPEDFPPGPLDFYWGSAFLPEKGFERRGNKRLDARDVIALERGVVVRDHGVRLARLSVLPKYREDLAQVLHTSVLKKSPGIENPVGVRLGDGIVLEEARLEPEVVRPFGVVKITTTWRVDAMVKGPWQMFTDLVAGGREEGRWHAPVDGLHPVTNWQPGTWVRDVDTISLPRWLSTGTVDIWIGFGYERKHMAITERGRGVTDSRKRIKIGTIRIAP